MNKFSGYYVFILLIFFALCGCKKTKEEPKQTEAIDTSKGSIQLSFNHVIGTSPLILNSGKYTNLNGDTFTVSSFKYYISNVKLKLSNGTFFSVPESYYLVDVSSVSKSTITINNISPDNYSQIILSLGIDSVRNHTGTQTGSLDPSNGMIWDWTNGYKFFNLLGNYKDASSSAYKPMSFQVGSDLNYKTFVFDNAIANWNDIKVATEKTTKVVVNVNIKEAFQTPTTISFKNLHDVSFDANGKIIAHNYADMLSLSQIFNP